jgi:long-chain acyl-CoA synthetase
VRRKSVGSPRLDAVAADTLPGLLAARVASSADALAFRYEDATGAWHSVTWAQFDRRVGILAARFAVAGLRPGERFGVLAPTSFGWELAQFAAMLVGATVVGIDPHYGADDIERVLRETDVAALAVGSVDALPHGPVGARERFRFVVLTGLPAAEGFESVLDWSRGGAPLAPELRADRADAAALVALSSGTTGRPQPVFYSHRQVLLACRAIVDLYPEVGASTPLLSWLPMANLFQRMMNFCGIMRGLTIHLVEDPRRVMDVMPVVRPEVLIAVPRFCERVRQQVQARMGASPVRRLAWSTAWRAARARRRRRRGVRGIAWRIADRAVMARVRKAFGGRLRFIVCGSAPMPTDLLEWFDTVGIPVLEAYGTTENIVPIAANTCADRAPGTVGRPVSGNDVRLSADDEILVRGDGVLLPQLEGNRARTDAFTADGFLRTGDLGRFDAEGHLCLLGRRNEVFKGTDGRWIAPTDIEAALSAVAHVDQCAVFRTAGHAIVAVLTLGPGAAQPGVEPTPALRAALESAVAKLPPASRPAALLIAREFSIAGGELTTNLKLRRAFIADEYRARSEEILASRQSGTSPPAIALA